MGAAAPDALPDVALPAFGRKIGFHLAWEYANALLRTPDDDAHPYAHSSRSSGRESTSSTSAILRFGHSEQISDGSSRGGAVVMFQSRDADAAGPRFFPAISAPT